MKSYFVKTISVLLAMISLISVAIIPISASAAQLKVNSDGAKWTMDISYVDSLGVSHTIKSGQTFARLSIDNKSACCIQLGSPVYGLDEYQASDSIAIWNSLSETQKNYLALTMAFGKPNYDREHYYATQLIIWEITCGFRTCNTDFATTKNLLNCVDLSATGVHVPSVITIYSQTVEQVKNWYKTPSGMSKSTETVKEYNLTYNPATNRYECTVSVANGVLDGYNLVCSNSSYTITNKTANSFTIAAPKGTTAACTVTANKIIPAYDSSYLTENLVVWYKSGKQALVTGAYFDPVSAVANFTTSSVSELRLDKEFYSQSTKITAQNVNTITSGASMSELYKAVRFAITADINGKTYYVKPSTNPDYSGNYTFGGFTENWTLFDISQTNGTLKIAGLPTGYTYKITETQSFANDNVTFRTAAQKLVNLSANTAINVKNYITPKVQTTNFYIDKNVLHADSTEFADSDFLSDYYENVSFYLYTFDDSGNKRYLQLQNASNGRYAGYITINSATNTTEYSADYLTTSRQTATEIKLASDANDITVPFGKAYFYNIPQFANGLYLEEIIGSKYLDGFGSAGTYQIKSDCAVFELAKSGEYLSEYYEIDNIEKTFDVVAFKVDVNDSDNNMMSKWISGGEFGLFSAEDELIATSTCENGVVAFSNITQVLDENCYIKETTAPQGYTLSSEKYNLRMHNGAYEACISGEIVRISEKPIYGQIEIEKTDSITNAPLGNATFALKAAQDITVANEVVFAQGDAIPTISLDDNGAFVFGESDYTVTTDENGKAVFDFLPLGSYEIVETDVPQGYVRNTSSAIVEVSDDGNSQSIGYVNVTVPIANTLQGGVLHIYKTDGDTEKPLAGAEFTIYAAEDFIIDGKVIHAKGDVICVLTTDKNGYASNLLEATSVEVGEQTYFPMYVGTKYYAKETKAPQGYVIDGEAQYFEFDYKGAEVQYSEFDLREENSKTPTVTTTTTTITTTTTATDSPPKTGVYDNDIRIPTAILLGISTVGFFVLSKSRKKENEVNE